MIMPARPIWVCYIWIRERYNHNGPVSFQETGPLPYPYPISYSAQRRHPPTLNRPLNLLKHIALLN